MSRFVMLALLCAAACDRGRFDTLERRVEALEKKGTESSPVVAAVDTAKANATLEQELAAATASRVAADEKLAALQAQLAELQEQYNALQEQIAKAGVTTTTIATGGKVGIKACDEYIEKYTRCIEDKVPSAARGTMQDAMDATAKAWREAAAGPAREGLGKACEAALDAARMATASMGCEW